VEGIRKAAEKARPGYISPFQMSAIATSAFSVYKEDEDSVINEKRRHAFSAIL